MDAQLETQFVSFPAYFMSRLMPGMDTGMDTESLESNWDKWKVRETILAKILLVSMV